MVKLQIGLLRTPNVALAKLRISQLAALTRFPSLTKFWSEKIIQLIHIFWQKTNRYLTRDLKLSMSSNGYASWPDFSINGYFISPSFSLCLVANQLLEIKKEIYFKWSVHNIKYITLHYYIMFLDQAFAKSSNRAFARWKMFLFCLKDLMSNVTHPSLICHNIFVFGNLLCKHNDRGIKDKLKKLIGILHFI